MNIDPKTRAAAYLAVAVVTAIAIGFFLRGEERCGNLVRGLFGNVADAVCDPNALSIVLFTLAGVLVVVLPLWLGETVVRAIWQWVRKLPVLGKLAGAALVGIIIVELFIGEVVWDGYGDSILSKFANEIKSVCVALVVIAWKWKILIMWIKEQMPAPVRRMWDKAEQEEEAQAGEVTDAPTTDSETPKDAVDNSRALAETAADGKPKKSGFAIVGERLSAVGRGARTGGGKAIDTVTKAGKSAGGWINKGAKTGGDKVVDAVTKARESAGGLINKVRRKKGGD